MENEYSPEMLARRLRRLEEENAVLRAEKAEQKAPRCVAFVQTGSCDPDGPIEARRDCGESVPRGASGFCECRDGIKVSRVGCDHEPFTCSAFCESVATVSVGVGATGRAAPLVVAAGDGSPTIECGLRRGCAACAAAEGCA
eukprot:7380962-Prymnesium_polylepis.1